MQQAVPASAELSVPKEESGCWPQYVDHDALAADKDHFVQRDGLVFAGTHLLLDLWGAKRLDDLERMEKALRDCVDHCGATLLHIHLHHFTPNGGISGVAVLAESHISVHTWPEREYAAFDIFMCGDALPEKGVEALKKCFGPCNVTVTEHKRGVF